MNNPKIFLLSAFCLLAISLFYYFIYPHPKNIKVKKKKLTKSHDYRVAHLQKSIDLAKSHHSSSKVYGGAEPWAQAQREELSLTDELNLEDATYKENIEELEKFPLKTSFIIVGFFLTLIGFYLTTLQIQANG